MLTIILLLAAIDPRLATVKTIFVVPADDFENDRPVVACLIEHLPTALPLKVVNTPDEADIVLKIKASIAGDTTRKIAAAIGGAGSVSLGTVYSSAWIGDKLIWKDNTTVDAGSNLIKRTAQEDFCSLADASINDLRKGMQKARRAQ